METMAEGSSVDRENPKWDGLNVTSDIVNEENYEANITWESLLEDSIDQRAAKALNIHSVRELLKKESETKGNLSPAHSIIGAIYSSMNSDIQQAVRSLSPGRKSGRSSSASTKTASYSGNTSSSSNKSDGCTSKIEPYRSSTPKYLDIEDIGQLENLHLFPNNDSLLSEPEIEVAFDRPPQTMDILSAAGNLQARRERHGGYGTPSSYASDQEMILYFDNSMTPTTKMDENLTSSSSEVTPVESNGKGMLLISQMENRMQELIESPSYLFKELTYDPRLIPRSISLEEIKDDKPNNNIQSATKKCEDTIQALEDLASSPKQLTIGSQDEPTEKILGNACNFNGNSNLALQMESTPEKVSKGAQRLLNMIKMASDIVITDEMNESKILELSSPGKNTEPATQSLESFQEFQDCLNELKLCEKQRLDESNNVVINDNINNPKVVEPTSHNKTAKLEPQSLESFQEFQDCLNELKLCEKERFDKSKSTKNNDATPTVAKEQHILIDFSELMDSIQNCKQEIMSSFNVNGNVENPAENSISPVCTRNKKIANDRNQFKDSVDSSGLLLKKNPKQLNDQTEYDHQLEKVADNIVTELLESFSRENSMLSCSTNDVKEENNNTKVNISNNIPNPIIVINDVDGKVLATEPEVMDSGNIHKQCNQFQNTLPNESTEIVINEPLVFEPLNNESTYFESRKDNNPQEIKSTTSLDEHKLRKAKSANICKKDQVSFVESDDESEYDTATHTCLKQANTMGPNCNLFKIETVPFSIRDENKNTPGMVENFNCREKQLLVENLGGSCNDEKLNNDLNTKQVTAQTCDPLNPIGSEKKVVKFHTENFSETPKQRIPIQDNKLINFHKDSVGKEKLDTYAAQILATQNVQEHKAKSIDASNTTLRVIFTEKSNVNKQEKFVTSEMPEFDSSFSRKRSLHFDDFGDPILDIDFTKYPDLLNVNGCRERVYDDLDGSNSSNHSFLLTDLQSNENEVITTSFEKKVMAPKLKRKNENYVIETTEIIPGNKEDIHYEKLATPMHFKGHKLKNKLQDSTFNKSAKPNVVQRAKITKNAKIPEKFELSFHKKFKDLDNKINEILKPSPPKPISIPVPNETYISAGSAKRSLVFEQQENNQIRLKSVTNEPDFNTFAPIKAIPDNAKSLTIYPHLSTSARRNIFPNDIKDAESVSTPRSYISFYNIDDSVMEDGETFLRTVHLDILPQEDRSSTSRSEEMATVAKAMTYIKHDLARGERDLKKLQNDLNETWTRMQKFELEMTQSDVDSDVSLVMSSHHKTDRSSTSKVRALEEVVCLLKKHVHQREVEIESLGKQFGKSNDRIKSLEKKLNDKSLDEYRIKGLRHDKDELFKKLKSMQIERDELKLRIETTSREKEDALRASRKAREDLKAEKEIQSSLKKGMMGYGVNKELHERVTELEYLNRSSAGELERAEKELDSLKRENRSMRMSNEQAVEDLKVDNTIMREKLDRMHELSAENLLLQSDSADYQAELTELRDEAKDLRSRCYELTEENRQCKAEIRDLRRFIDLLKANKTGDSRQDLVNKIEYYQMEHDRLMDEVRRLKQRLGDISPPRTPRSPKPYSRHAYGEEKELRGRDERVGKGASKPGVRFSSSLERGRSPVGDCMAASSASCHAASRIMKDGRSLSPSAALNIRDLTMERYNQHMEGEINRPNSPDSIDSDATELLLKPQPHVNGHTAPPRDCYSDDEDDVEINLPAFRNGKLTDSSESGGCIRASSGDRITRSSHHKRSQSPINPIGFRSLSPKMTSTQNNIQDTARDRYPTNIKRSLPRRAFAPRSPADLMLGYCIKFTRPGGKLSRGTVRYIGHLPTRDEIFIGVELDGHDGKHAGTFQGKKYFTCPQNKGIFTPFSKVIMAWE